MNIKKSVFYKNLLIAIMIFSLPITGFNGQGKVRKARKAEAAKVISDEIGAIIKLNVGEKDVFSLADDSQRYAYLFDGEDVIIKQIEYVSMDSDILSVTTDGAYEALKVGSTELKVTFYAEKNSYSGTDYSGYEDDDYYDDNADTETYTATEYIPVKVYPDMSNVTLEKSTYTIYQSAYSYSSSPLKIKVISDIIFNDTDENTEFYVSKQGSSETVSATLKNNVISISGYFTGTTKFIININNKIFNVTVKIKSVSIKGGSFLLAKKKTKTLKVKNSPGNLKWKTSNKKIATVNKKGKVKAKKEGNAIIYAYVGSEKIGCIVSVTTNKKIKVIKKAKSIAKSSTYSQPKRMQKGFYDCSSLVWRSYKALGVSVASKTYAPTAADMAKWCAGRKKLLKGGLSKKNITKMKINPGDLFFETGANNGRYKGIYHVEMFAGYELLYFDSKGKPVVCSKWANRLDGYYGYAGQLIGRM